MAPRSPGLSSGCGWSSLPCGPRRNSAWTWPRSSPSTARTALSPRPWKRRRIPPRTGRPGVPRAGHAAAPRTGRPGVPRVGHAAALRTGRPGVPRAGHPAARRVGRPGVPRTGEPGVSRTGGAAAAQRQLDELGKVNPLALEEFAALEERHSFLATQLEDLKKTRRDLLIVVKEVDDRVQQVFTAAFEDTAREFEDIFGRLFPGGEGRLVLTEPDDMLATGIDFEARPPGKKVKRLSLLSGGERSLTAIAFLVAIS